MTRNAPARDEVHNLCGGVRLWFWRLLERDRRSTDNDHHNDPRQCISQKHNYLDSSKPSGVLFLKRSLAHRIVAGLKLWGLRSLSKFMVGPNAINGRQRRFLAAMPFAAKRLR